MHHDESCACDHQKLEDVGEERVEDCPRCGAIAWTGDDAPVDDAGEPLTCSACGGRVIAWMGERRVTTLRRCLSCDEVVSLSV